MTNQSNLILQVHKKLCIPGIFQRGRLYKAQSCGSIVRDKVNHNPKSSTTTSRHSALFSDKTRILRNCLGARLLGSDGDINQNGKTNNSVLQFSIPSKNSKKTTSPIHNVSGDSSLCSSQC